MKNKFKIVFYTVLTVVTSCTFKSIGNKAINERFDRNYGKSVFLLAYIKDNPYESNNKNDKIIPKSYNSKNTILILPINILEAFCSKDSFVNTLLDEESDKEFLNRYKLEKGYTDEKMKEESVKIITRYKYAYLELEKNSQKKKVISFFQNKQLVLLRADYSYLANDSSIFIRNLYLPNEVVFKKYLEKYKP